MTWYLGWLINSFNQTFSTVNLINLYLSLSFQPDSCGDVAWHVVRLCFGYLKSLDLVIIRYVLFKLLSRRRLFIFSARLRIALRWYERALSNLCRNMFTEHCVFCPADLRLIEKSIKLNAETGAVTKGRHCNRNPLSVTESSA